MAFPWIFAEDFEAGTRGNFDAETDTATILEFSHYSALARRGATPFRGAYCLHVQLNGGTTSAYVQENTAFDDLAANGTVRYLRFYFYLGKDFVMADGDKFSLMELESTLDTTTEVACGIDRSGSAIRFWYAETSAAAAQTIVLGSTTTALNRWYSAELEIDIDNGVNNDGTITGYINDFAGTQITALDQAAIVDGKFGVIGPDAGTSGVVLIDDILYDDGRIYARKERFPLVEVMTASGHVFLGPGAIQSAHLLSAQADDIIRLFDTDSGNANSLNSLMAELDANTSETGPLWFERGCYAELTGTNPRGKITLPMGFSDDGYPGPVCRSSSMIVHQGLNRRIRGNNV